MNNLSMINLEVSGNVSFTVLNNINTSIQNISTVLLNVSLANVSACAWSTSQQLSNLSSTFYSVSLANVLFGRNVHDGPRETARKALQREFPAAVIIEHFCPSQIVHFQFLPHFLQKETRVSESIIWAYCA